MTAPDDRSTTAERLRSDVEALCAVRDRRVGSPGHDAARAYLSQRYAAIGLRPYGDTYELPYAGGGINFTNLLAVAPAKDAAANDAAPLLIAAHYDTVADTPGADDNAAAIAITLEVARRLTRQPAARPVLIAQFDAEEPPTSTPASWAAPTSTPTKPARPSMPPSSSTSSATPSPSPASSKPSS